MPKRTKKSQSFWFFIMPLLAAISFLVFGSNRVYAFSGTGTGTINDPYVITSKAQLQEMSSNLSASYKLGSDIDLQSSEWTPIGTSSTKFSGVLDGNGHTIKNLSINKLNVEGNGLFGYVSNGVIKNLNVKGVNVIGGNCTGAIAASVTGTSTVDNCSADGKIFANSNAGGLIGTASGLKINNSYSAVTVNASGDNEGGIVGSLTGNITNSYAISDVISKSGSSTGGLVGWLTGDITKCYTTNNISSSGNYTGGLAGWHQGIIDESYVAGSVTSTGSYVGGLAGSINSTTVQNSFNLAPVSGASYVGGINGNASGSTVKDSYSAGKITASSGNAGGLTGTNETVTDSYYDGTAAGYVPQNTYDASRSTTSMEMQSTFNNWEFLDTWAIDEGKSYPYLRNVKKPDGVTKGLPSEGETSGSGTQNNPYIISNVQQLKNMNYNLTAYYKLANDIDLSSINWTPIGNNNVPFTGVLDGDGHSIKNISMNRLGTDLSGLFGCISGATIKNLSINNVNIIGGNYTGAITGNVIGGKITSTIDNCYANGTIVGYRCTGGLVGYAYMDGSTNILNITNSRSSVNVTGSGDDVGGIIGALEGNISDSYATGTVISKSGNNTGALVGWSSGSISKCYTTNNVTSSQKNVGGISGNFQGTIDQCYSTGNIGGTDNIGGIVGYAASGTIQNSFSISQVSGNSFVGGIQGSGSTTIQNCYAAGKLTGTSNIGGITGSNYTVNHCYYDGIVSGCAPQNSNDAINSRITTAMREQQNFEGWEFINTWAIDEGKSYPYLKNVKKPDGLANGQVLTGKGTESDPYIINTVEQLQNIKYNLGGHYKLGNDIDLTGVKWSPIGEIAGCEFTGTLDGNGHSIKNLSMNRLGTDITGLFGRLKGATIKNLKLENVNLIGGNHTGAIAGYSENSTIDNCSASGTIYGYVYTGGLIGQGNNETNINNSSSSVSVSGIDPIVGQKTDTGQRIGGLAGELTGNITGSYVTGDVISKSGDYVGGLVGVLTGDITKSYVDNNVKSQGSYVGGLAGWLHGHVYQSYAVGVVIASLDNVGGLVGYSYAAYNISTLNSIENCFNLKLVQGRNYVGGIQGFDEGSTNTVGDHGYDYNYSWVTEYWYGDATIKNCYSAGKVVSSGNLGGLSGTPTIITNSYYDSISSEYSPENPPDVARLTTAMKEQGTFVNWEFINIWAIDEGMSYPYLIGVTKPSGVTEGLPTGEVAGGKGTANDPYIISTAQQLQNMKNDLGAYYKLANDIDLQGIDWEPVGVNSTVPFTGVFDGNGHSIKNLSIKKLGVSGIGLFGYISGATIKNLKLENVNITSGNYTGALVGNAMGVSTIDNCYSSGIITAYGNSGGLVGGTSGDGSKININNSGSSVKMTIVNGDGINGDNVGGIAGGITGDITNSYATGDITSKTGNSTGGLVGYINGNITQCYTTNNVNSNGKNAGGLAGYINGSISECYAAGSVTSTSNFVGGLIGYMNSGKVCDSFSLAPVSGASYVGGLLGYKNTTENISHCYSSGKITASGKYVGGITGAGGTIDNSYYDGISSGYMPQNANDISRITSSMKQKSNFLKWEFINIWAIDEGSSYPYLKVLAKPDGVAKGLPTGEVAGGKGTASDPYIIKTVEQLENIQCDPGAYYKLGNDIDLKGINWTPIGINSNVAFTGTLDGNGYSIENLSMNRLQNENSATGLFGYVTGGKIINLKLKNVNIIGRNYTGALAGYVLNSDTSKSVIDNCSADGIITAYGSTGGLVGYGNSLTITNSNSSVKVNITDEVDPSGKTVNGDNVGGIVGQIDGTGSIISNCYATGNVISKNGNDIGGLVGSFSGTITRCYTTNDVNAKGNSDKSKGSYVGGLVGYMSSGTIDQCYTTGSVTALVDDVGGLTGYSPSTTIQNSFSMSSVSGHSCVGGLQGNGSGTIQYCYSTGKITASGSYVGGIEGNGSTVVKSYYDGMASGYIPQNGNDASKLTNEMESKDTFQNWEFINTWGIDEGKSYPYLKTINKPDCVTVTDKNAAKGKGTAEDPYIITTVEQLENMKYDLTAHYKLGNDIDLSGVDWTPIGNSNAQFTGSFDGDGYSIKNLSMNKGNTDACGFFGYVGGSAEIKNVVMKNTNILAGDYVGALAANVSGKSVIDNCIVIDGNIEGGGYVGSLVGAASGLNISNSSSTARVIGTKDYVGGLIGSLSNGNITNCYTEGDVSSDGNYVGGLAGSIKGNITGSYSNGNVTSNSANNVGGLTGYLNGQVSQCYSTGTIKGVKNIGGLVGYSDSSTIQDSFNLGDVSGTDYIGGIHGTGNGATTIKTCYSAGKVVDAGSNLGGISAGGATITRSYFDSTASGIKTPTDEAKATNDLFNKNTFLDWEFVFTWAIDKAYPYLRKLSIPIFPNSKDQTKVPDGFKVIDVTGTTIKVQWGPIRGVVGYDIEVDGKIIDNGTDISYTSTGLAAGSTHTYRVRLRTQSGVGAWTNLITVITPGNMGNITSKVTSTSMNISWDKVDGAVGYDIEIDGKTIDNGNNTSYEVDGLAPGTANTYRVRAKNSYGIGDWSTLVSKQTLGEVVNIKSSTAGTSITLNWDAVGGAVKYEVEVDGKVIDNGNSTSYTSNDLQPGTTHTYRVRVITLDGTGDWSSSVVKTTLGVIPTSGVTAEVTGTSIKLSWNAITGATGYDVEVDGTIIDNGNNTSYTSLQLIPGTTHVYRIRPKTADTLGNFSDSIIKTAIGVIDVNGVTTEVTDTSIKLSWNAVAGATGYEVEVDGNTIDNGSSTVYTAEKLETGTTHTYRIRAKNADTIGSFSGTITKTILATLSPVNITTEVTGTSIKLSWNAVTGATGYDVEVNGNIIDNGNNTSYELKDLPAGTTYKFRVRAKCANGEGKFSDIITKTTIGAIDKNSITAKATDTTIKITWAAVTGATGYDVEVDGNVIDNGSSTSYVVTGLATGVTHTYRIRAKNADTVGSFSDPIVKTTLSPLLPTSVTAEVTGTSIKLSWNPVNGATGYDVEVDGTIVDNGSNTTYTAEDIKPGTKHTYRVRPKTDNGVGEWSNPISKIILSPISKNSITAEATDSTINLSWTPVAGATGYDVEINGQTIDNGNNTSYSALNLQAGSVYSIRIRPKTVDGAGDWSEIVTKTILSVIPTSGVTSVSTGTSVKLSWNAVAGATGYDVEVDGKIVDNGNSTVYEATGLVNGVTHTYRIRPKTSDTIGNFSDVITKTTLDVITSNDVTAEITDSTVKLTWKPVAGATGYDVEVDGKQVDNGNNTAYTASGLSTGVTHVFRIRAKVKSGSADWSENINKTTLATIPSSGVVSEVTGTSVKLTWSAVTGASGYDVEVDGKTIDNGNSTVYVATGLDVGVTHTYRIRPKTSDTIGNWSDEIKKTTLSVIPANDVASSVTDTSVKLEWQPVDGATGYDVEVDGQTVDNGRSTVYEATGLKPGITHSYRIRPKTKDGFGEWSDLIHKTTIAVLTENDITAVVTDSTIKLSWKALNGATGYDVEVDGKVIDNGDGTVYEATGLKAGVTHTYRIRGKTDTGIGDWSETVKETTLDSVSASGVTAIATGTSVKLTWGAVTGAAGYDIEVDGNVIDAGNNTSYEVDGLTVGTNHVFRIRAKADEGIGEWSAPINKVTLSSPSLSDITANVTESTVKLTWKAIDGATGYDVEVDGNPVDNGNSTSYTGSGFEAGTSHTFRIRAKVGNGAGDWSTAIVKTTLAQISMGSVKTTVTDTSIRLDWTAVKGATGYDVEIDGTAVIDNGDKTYYELDGLKPGTVHKFRVRGKTSDTVSNWSEVIAKTTLFVVPADKITVTATDTSIKLTWDAVSNATGYDVEVDGVTIDNGNSTVYEATGLATGTVHTYRVRAKSSDTTGIWSDTIVKATLSQIPVSNVTTSVAGTSVKLTWAAITGAVGYDVEVDGKVVDAGSSTSYEAVGLEEGTVHKFRVRAKVGNGSGDWSDIITRTTLAVIPSDKVISNVTASSVKLTWDAVKGAAGYDVEVDGVTIDNGNSTVYEATGLTAGVTHTYRVRAKSSDTTGEWSDPIVKTTLNVIPVGGITTAVTDNTVKLTWAAVDGATGYEVEVDGKVMDAGSNTSYEAAGLEAGVAHKFRVRAKTAKAAGDWSQFITRTPIGMIPKDGITLVNTDTGIKLSWAPVEGAAGYDVEINGQIIDNANSTSYEAKNLIAGVTYTCRVRAKSVDTTGQWSEPIVKTELSVIPVSGITTVVTDTTVKLTWAPVNGAVGYDVEIDGSTVDAGNAASYEAINLQAGTTHKFRVRAKTDKGTADWSEIVTRTTLAVIGNVTASSTDSSVKLSWTPVNGASGYDVEVDGKTIDNGTSTVYESDGLDAGITHTYRVRAKSSDTTGEWSSTITKTTLGVIPVSGITTSVTGTSVKLSWDVAKGAEGYDVEIDGNVVDVKDVTSYEAVNFEAGTTHKFRVRAKTAKGEGDWSDVITKTTLEKVPSDKIQASVTDSSIKLTWEVVTGAVSYDVEFDGNVVTGITGTSYEADGLQAGTTHKFMVRAKTADTTADWSDEVSKTTLGVISTDDITTSVGATSIKYSWKAVTGATGYDVEFDGKPIDNSSNTSYEVDGLQAGTTHEFRVRAKTIDTKGEWSDKVSKTILAVIPSTGITTSVSASSINYSWNAVVGAAGYDVEIDGKVIGNGNNTSYTAVGLDAGTKHTFRVRAKSADNMADWSDTLTKTTLAVISSNDVQTAATHTSINYSWNAVAGATGYDVELDGKQINDISGTSYTADGLDVNSSHTFRVRAKCSDTTGDWSDVITKATLPIDKVSGVSSTSTYTSIKVTWNAVNDVTGYDIEVNGKVIDAGNNTSYTAEGLDANTSYSFRVRAKISSAVGEWSDAISAKVMPAPIMDVETDNIINVDNNNIVNAGDTFTVTIGFKNAIDISIIQGLTVKYDSNLFDYVKAESADTGLFTIDSVDASNAGKITIDGENAGDKALNGDNKIIKLTFKAKTNIGKGDINILGGSVWNMDGQSYNATYSGQTFNTVNCDVNGDGKVDMQDYIAVKNCIGKTSDQWGKYKPDVNGDGIVDAQDKNCVYAVMKANSSK
ncbi:MULTISPECIES: fibronectin type III domain-containing protein [Clostridium]|uniref:fibronectin type III domain-containing protein n=1 Tax=Clostridium TaxID=1485 RepID=UPI000825A79F|nr:MULTISPECIES: fibronectin type III domain-containing protein [Clostridium]